MSLRPIYIISDCERQGFSQENPGSTGTFKITEKHKPENTGPGNTIFTLPAQYDFSTDSPPRPPISCYINLVLDDIAADM